MPIDNNPESSDDFDVRTDPDLCLKSFGETWSFIRARSNKLSNIISSSSILPKETALHLVCICLCNAKNTRKDDDFGLIIGTNSSALEARSLPKLYEQLEQVWISDLLDFLEL